MQYIKSLLTFQKQAELLPGRGLQADKYELILRLESVNLINQKEIELSGLSG